MKYIIEFNIQQGHVCFLGSGMDLDKSNMLYKRRQTSVHVAEINLGAVRPDQTSKIRIFLMCAKILKHTVALNNSRTVQIWNARCAHSPSILLWPITLQAAISHYISTKVQES